MVVAAAAHLTTAVVPTGAVAVDLTTITMAGAAARHTTRPSSALGARASLVAIAMVFGNSAVPRSIPTIAAVVAAAAHLTTVAVLTGAVVVGLTTITVAGCRRMRRKVRQKSRKTSLTRLTS